MPSGLFDPPEPWFAAVWKEVERLYGVPRVTDIKPEYRRWFSERHASGLTPEACALALGAHFGLSLLPLPPVRS